MNASFLVKSLRERSLSRSLLNSTFSSSSSSGGKDTVPLADYDEVRFSSSNFKRLLLLPEPKSRAHLPSQSLGDTDRTSSSEEEEKDRTKTTAATSLWQSSSSLVVDFPFTSDDDDDRSICIEDIEAERREFSSNELPDDLDLGPDRSSGAVSLESSRDLEGLAELAPAMLVDGGDSFAVLADFNARSRSSWADFSLSSPPVGENTAPGAIGDSAAEASTSRARRAAEEWARSRRTRRKSWLDLEDLLIEEEEEEHAPRHHNTQGEEQQEEELAPTDPIIKMVRFRPLRKYHRDGGDAHPHISRSDMSQSELHATWYDEYDHEELQMEVVETLMILRNVPGAPVKKHEGDICARGLEHAVDETLSARRERRKAEVVGAVLRAQQGRKDDPHPTGTADDDEHNDNDEEAIAEASRSLTKEARDMARLMGKNDAAVVRVMLRPHRCIAVKGGAGWHQRRGSLTPAAA